MMIINKKDLTERFMRYVQIDTQSDPNSQLFPSTEKQKNLSKLLAQELQTMGYEDAADDTYGYVYATIPANTGKADVPVICFCSHVDTAPDCSGTGVKPLLHRRYAGGSIILPDDPTQVLHPDTLPYLRQKMGSDIITASGNTLLGADDKAGVSIIMELASFLAVNPQIKHGKIRILFTPDEEVGRGTAKIDMAKLGAGIGYTLDGGEAGSLEDETFSADGAGIIVHGIIAHPGYAKDTLVNAIKIVSAIADALPKKGWSPETTEARQGFVHPVAISGIAEKARIDFILRDFTTEGLANHHIKLKALAEEVVARYPGARMEYFPQEQYRNMKEVLDKNPEITAYAAEAIQRSGLTVKKESIRGGTDGSRLSYMGLPCPNIFTGMQGIHSKQEWVAVDDMAKAVETLVHLAMIWEEKSQ